MRSLILVSLFMFSSIASADCCCCHREESKLDYYSDMLDAWDLELAECREEASSDRSKSCFFSVKFSAYYADKVEKWEGKLAECKEKHDSPAN